MLIPRRCPLCERPGPAPCASCASGLRRAGQLAPLPGLDSVAAVFAYEGSVRALLLALKYRNRRDARAWFGAQLARAVVAPVESVTWAPTSARRASRRGYDQAELLARDVAGRLRVPCVALLRRTGTVAQTGLDAAARHGGPAFEPRARRTRRAGAVLVVDDVTTTGATLAAAASALRLGGASAVHGVVVAHTPRAGTGPSAGHRADVAGLRSHATDPWGGPACTSPSAAARR
jgi:predicted amidophosphoribosyltransferase